MCLLSIAAPSYCQKSAMRYGMWDKLIAVKIIGVQRQQESSKCGTRYCYHYSIINTMGYVVAHRRNPLDPYYAPSHSCGKKLGTLTKYSRKKSIVASHHIIVPKHPSRADIDRESHNFVPREFFHCAVTVLQTSVGR